MSASCQFEGSLVIKCFCSSFYECFLAFHQFFNFIIFPIDSLVICKENITMAHCSENLRAHLALRYLSLLTLKHILPLVGIHNVFQRFEEITLYFFDWICSNIFIICYDSPCICISSWFLLLSWLLIDMRIRC